MSLHLSKENSSYDMHRPIYCIPVYIFVILKIVMECKTCPTYKDHLLCVFKIFIMK